MTVSLSTTSGKAFRFLYPTCCLVFTTDARVLSQARNGYSESPSRSCALVRHARVALLTIVQGQRTRSNKRGELPAWRHGSHCHGVFNHESPVVCSSHEFIYLRPYLLKNEGSPCRG